MKKLYTFIFISIIWGSAAMAALPHKVAGRAGTLATPVVLPATDVSPKGFTANWEAVPGASLYQATVYEPIKVTADGEYIVLEEDFNLVSAGTFEEPVFPEDWVVMLNDFDWVTTPDWMGFMPVFARGMVSGIVYSPYIDLTNDGGKFTVNVTVTGYAGGKVVLESNGNGDVQSKELLLKNNGANEFSVEFTNGAHDTFVVFTDYGIADDPEQVYTDCYDFLDDIQFVQNLKADDTYLRLVEYVETDENSGVTSHKFSDMKYLDGACDLVYDVMAIQVVYTNPDDEYEYETYYSDYSVLQPVSLNSGVEDVEVDSDAEVEYYNLQGVKMEGALTPGIYIRRQGNKAVKVKI